MYKFIYIRESILGILIFDSLYFFLFLIVLLAVLVFIIIKKSVVEEYEDRVVPDFYRDLGTDTDEVEELIGASYAKQYIQNYKGAIKDLTKVLKLSPNSVEVYVMRGKLYIELGENNKAINDFNSALRLNPQNETAYYYRGKAKYANGDVYEASTDFAKAEELGFIYKEE